MPSADRKLTRIGVFYDGNFFLHVSNYYHYVHSRKSRISISGLHQFIRHKVAAEEGVDARYCQIVDAHYFRGRLRAQDAEQRDILLKERLFDDVLMRQGVTTHYLPLGPGGEKGIDVWLALEAYELAIYKRFDVSVIVASDGDFVPLVRKLSTVGTRVMLMAWDFKFTDQNDQERETRTSQALLAEVTYPVLMHEIIDDRSLRNAPLINGLFVPKSEFSVRSVIAEANPKGGSRDDTLTGRIQNLKEGFGFITPTVGGSNLFFFHASVLNADFAELKIGDCVEYEMGTNEKGPCAVSIKVV
ncbi:cold-shock protein [Ectothiorhodospira shaposhnikovii]|uniref:NYN domain-containing protein n=1 Tax=Ectothiorhodospira shaposhnikovii TaxID=1054 RepID=UPI001903041E|nr:NYN domain-containing protein [Ectothiorhodospira shaposhnikovii]MBK1673936.1 cold-shock protein [Ectothiorhodospira shaposhnikovii]